MESLVKEKTFNFLLLRMRFDWEVCTLYLNVVLVLRSAALFTFSRQHLPAPLLPISTSAKVQRIIKFEASRERGHDFKQMQEAVKGDTWAGGKDMMTNNNIITYKIFTELLIINSLYRIKLQR